MSRQTAIRKKCLDCSGDSANEVRNCSHTECQLYPFRITAKAGHGYKARAIKEFCLECCNGSAVERRLCPAEGCPLYEYRCGTKRKTPQNTETATPQGV